MMAIESTPKRFPVSDSTLILTIESTCDETAAAVINGDLKVLGSVVASQDELHQKFNGVVPEIAARAHVERILPVIHETLQKSGVTLEQMAAVAVAHTPGLAGSLLVGLVAAKAICLATDLPLITINHLYAHIYACQMSANKNVFPSVGLIVSGGHSHLYHCHNALEFEYLGGTIDDAAGEAFDKVASMLGLPYPGGPSISKAAEDGDPTAFKFPRSFIKEARLDFSFSGLKTAVRYTLGDTGKIDFASLDLSKQLIADVAASFQAAVVDCLVAKSLQACAQLQLKKLCIGGGVAANKLFRQEITEATKQGQVELHIAPFELCTDNAVMGAIALEKLKVGQFDSLDIDIKPGLVRH